MADTWGENDKPLGKVAAADDWGQNDKPAAPAETWGGDDAPPARGLKGWGQDIAATAVKAAISVPEAAAGVADLVTGGKAGKALEDVGVRFKEAREIAEGWHSDATKHAKREFADADGIVDKAKVAVTNPALVGMTIGESLGLMGGGGVVGRGVMAAVPKLGPVAATAIGEGVAGAGSAAESIRQETDNGELSAKQAALAAGSGVATGVLGAVGGAAARKLGVGDADVMLTQGWKGLFKQHADDAAAAAAAGTAPAAKSLPRQVIEGAMAEGLLEELPQSVSEQVLQNIALDKPWNEGVDEAIVMGTLSGMAMGGGASGIKAFTEPGAPAGKDQPASAQTDPATPAPAPVQPGPAATGPATPAPTPEQPSPAAAAPTPAEQLGIKAEAGTLSSAAAKAVNEGISPVQPGLASTATQPPVTDGPKDAFGNPTDDARRAAQDDATRTQLDSAVREAQAAGDAEAIAAATRARRMWDAQAKPTAQLAQEYHELSAAQDVPYKPQVMQAILDELGSRGFTLDRVIDNDTGEIQGYRAKPLLPKTEARPVQPGVYATYEEAAAARAEQAARGSTVKAIPSPVEGGFILAIKGTPEYERGLKLANERWAEQQRQRDKRKKEEQRAQAQQQKQAEKTEKTPQAQASLGLEQAPASGLQADGASAVSAAAASAEQSAPASGAQADAGVVGASSAGAGDAVTAGQAIAQQIAREGNEARRQRMVQASIAWTSMKPEQRQAVVKAAKGVNLTKKGQLHTQAWADMSDKQRQALAKAMDSMPTQQPTAVAQAPEQAELATQSAGAPAAAESPVPPQPEQKVAAAAPTQDVVTRQQEGVTADSQASPSAAEALPQPSEAAPATNGEYEPPSYSSVTAPAPAPEPAKASKPKPAAKSPDLSAYDKVAQEYGMRVKEDGTIVLANGKDSSIRVALKGGRMRAEGKDGSLQFSGVGPAALGKFVEKFWHATKIKPGQQSNTPKEQPAQAQQALAATNKEAEKPVDQMAVKKAAPTLAQLRQAVNDAKPLSDAHLEAIQALKAAAVADAQAALDAGQMPVYKSEHGLTSAITPSAQQDGMLQVTRYNSTGAVGDSQYKTLQEAISDNGLHQLERLPADEAEKHMQQLMEAEAEYQRKRQERYQGPADVSSAAGQKELANRGATIAALQALNGQLRSLDANAALADSEIVNARDLDALRDRISQALVNAQRAPKAPESQEAQALRQKLEEASAAELKAVFDRMGLAGKLMSHGERVEALMAEDHAQVLAALATENKATSAEQVKQSPKNDAESNVHQAQAATKNEPAAPAAPAAPAERFEQLRAAASDEQGMLAAFAQVAGRTGEKPADVYNRWHGVMGFYDAINKRPGAEVVKAMEGALLKQPYANDDAYPGGRMPVNADRKTAERYSQRVEREAKQLQAELDRHEERAQDAENFGASAQAVKNARDAIMAMRKRIRTIEQDAAKMLEDVATQEQNAAAAELQAYKEAFKRVEARELARKPTPASLLSWSTSSYKGEPAYTNGYLIDVGGGEPHIKDWVNRRNALRPTVTEGQLTRLVEQGLSKSHDPVKLVATFEKSNWPRPIALYEREPGQPLVVLDANYVRYFLSKYKGATILASADPQQPVVFMQGDKPVGVLMGIKPMVLDDKGSTLLTAEHVRAYMKESGNDKPADPKTVPERMREAAAEEAKYENAPAESPVDAAAAEAAPNPTEAQREAGNYQKGHMAIDGLEISIETQAGSSRRPEWPPLANHYGYFKGTVGKDKDHVDVFLLPEASDTSRPVVVIDQNHANGQFDEHKVVLGAADAEEAVKAYHANYSKDWKGYGGHAVMSWEEFKAWVKNPALTKQRAAPQGKAAAATATDDHLTPEAARGLLEWESMGTKGGVTTHKLYFYATPEDQKARRSRMEYGTVTKGDRSADKWTAEGSDEHFVMLPHARTAAINLAMQRLQRDGYVMQYDSSLQFPMQEAVSSYSGISHNGTGRAQMDMQDFDSYMQTVAKAGMDAAKTPAQQEAARQAVQQVRADYLKQYRALMQVRASTYSGFVAGRGNLNSKQANSRNSALDRAMDRFNAWTAEHVDDAKRAALAARTPEEVQADRQALADAIEAKAAKRRADTKAMLSKILSFKPGQPVAIVPKAEMVGLSFDRDGYPSSIKLKSTDGEPLTDDKFEVVRLFRRMNETAEQTKAMVRELVDELRAENPALARTKTATAPAAEKKAEAAQAPASLLDRHNAIARGLNDGTLQLEEYKAAFSELEANEEQVRAELSKLTKDALLRSGGYVFRMRYAPEKKEVIVSAALEEMRRTYALGRTYGPTSYMMSAGGIAKYKQLQAEALRELVANTTAEDLAKRAAEVQAARDEYKAQVNAHKEALANPQSLQDFRKFMQHWSEQGDTSEAAYLRLTPEQRRQFDELEAESTRERREAAKRAAKTAVATAGNTSANEVIATKHTKHGHDLFVVKLADRVERDAYLTLNASAKRLGGSYSSYRGNGAIPGFQFRTREAAEAFRKLVSGDTKAASELAEKRRDAFDDDKSQTVSERLSTMAEALEEQADAALSMDRKTNTARRARFAASAESAARYSKALAGTMRNIAKAIDAGTAKFVDGVRQKVQVEFLMTALRRAKEKQLEAKYPSYADRAQRTGEPIDAETVDFAEWPQYVMFRSDLASLARQLQEVEGGKKLGAVLGKLADDVTEAYTDWAKANLLTVSKFGRGDALADFSSREDAERAIRRSNLVGKAIVLPIKRGQNRVVLAPSEAMKLGLWQGDGDKRIQLTDDFVEELVKLGKRKGSKAVSVPWQIEGAYEKRTRLQRMGIQTPAEWRSALREFANLQEAMAAPDRIKEMERAMIGRRNDGLDFFPTSPAVVNAMLEAAEIQEGMSVLEPSAGMGHIADAIVAESGVWPDVVELSGDRRELLLAKGYYLTEYNDFLQMEPRKFFSYGDTFRAPDGTEGIMSGVGGMGSQRVRLEDKDGNRLGLYDRSDLVGIAQNGTWSGYDRIVMNPPFSDSRDIAHVQHAYNLLKPGGRIVAIMGESAFFNSNKKAQAFREWLEERGATNEKLPEGSFMDPSLPVNTGVSARMVVIDKPAGDLQLAQESRAEEAAYAGARRMGKSGTPSDRAVMDMVREGATTAQVLKFISATSRSAFNRKLAKVLLKTGISPKLTMGAPMGGADGFTFLAKYNRPTDTVTMTEGATHMAEQIMLHELVHAATLKALDSKGLASMQMRRLYEHVKKQGGAAGQYGMKNVREFVAEAFTNPEFQRALKGMSAPAQSTLGSAWDSLVRVIKRILGLPAQSTDALSAAMSLGINVMRENMMLARSARSKPADGSQDAHYAEGQQHVAYAEARALLDGVAAQLPLAKDFILLNSARQLGVPLPPDTPKGALIDGRVYLFADAHSDGLDFVQTIFHEMLHAGVARAVPADQRAALFSQLLNSSEVVRDKARAWAASATGMHQRDELRKQGLAGRELGNAWGNLAIEEALAEVSEDLAAHNLVGTKRSKTVTALANWLASVAQAMNLQQLADRIRAFTHTEVEAFVVRMLSVDGTLPVLEQPDNLTRNRTARPELNAKTLREVSGAAKEYVNELMSTAPGGISWWHKTIGTQHNLAEKHKEYRPVFKAAQQFIDDVSSLANEVSDLAPRLLPKLDTLRDLKFWGKNAKKPVSAVDNKAIAKPLFEGTLLWTRDFEGKPILVADLETMTASWTLEQKAQQLVATREYGPNVIRMWQSLPQSQYEAIITSVFKKRLLQPGIRWTDAELREMFQLNDAQLGLFREARTTIDASLDKTARAEILRLLGSEYADLRDVVMDAPDLETAMDVVTSMLHEMALQDDTGAERLLSLHDEVVRAATRARDLIAKGYAPLQRFGEHTVDVVDKDGNRLYFGLFESKGEAADMAKQMQELYAEEGATVTRGKLSKLEHKLFAGVNPESLELFGDMLGLGMDGNEAKDLAFQEFIRKTKNNHSALKRLIHRKGIAGYSEDVGRVLASFVYSNARQGAGALNAGAMERAIQAIPKGKGELKDAAMALREYISNPQEEGQLVRGFLFAQYLGGSIASALVNMTQPAAVTFPWLTQFTSARNAAAQLSRAMADMATRGKKYEPDLAKDLQAAEDDGTVSPQEIHQLMAQARGEASLRAGDGTAVGEAKAAANNFWRRTVVAWGQPFAWAEQFNRRSTFIAAYRIARANGHDNPAEFARVAVQESQFMYSKANKMRFARGAIGGTLMTFKTYSVSYLELLHRMWTQGGPEGKRATVLALGMLMLMGGAGGLPFVEDVEDMANALAAKMGYSFNTKQTRKEFLASLVGEWGADFIENGVSGLPGAPIDVSGRLGMGNLIPGTGLMGPNENKSRDILEMVGPAGDFVQRVFAGAGMALGGNLTGAAMEVSPTAVRNLAKGVEMGFTGLYTNKDGYKILDTTLPEAIAKGIGFQPKSVADVQETNVFMARARSFYTQTSAEIRAQWARGIAEGDQSAIDAARERMLDWNRKNPEQPIRIRVPDLHKRAREMRKDRTQRLADTAPKALRESLRDMARDASR